MKLADDTRARVPFAVVGILLLLGSAVFVATVDRRGPAPDQPDAVAASEQLDSVVTATVKQAVREASVEAARQPVVETADTPAGRLLNGSDTFERYLELRAYLAVQRALERTHVTVGAVAGSASLPATTDNESVVAALDRMDIEAGARNASVQVTIRNVTKRLARGGRTIEATNETVTVTVATPVLELHERVETYETRLNTQAGDGPGLGRRVAFYLYAFAWEYGYLQYFGAPIQNVVANRHVSVVTNYALLEVQRSVFGRSDPVGREATEFATLNMLYQDVKESTGGELQSGLDKYVTRRAPVPFNPVKVPSLTSPPGKAPSMNSTLTVGLDETADHMFVALLDGVEGAPGLDSVLDGAYRAQAQLHTETLVVRDDPRPDPEPPSENWTLAGRTVDTHTSVTEHPGPIPVPDSHWHRFEKFTRQVEIEKVVTWTWTNDNNTTRTSGNWTRVVNVGIALEGNHVDTGVAPGLPVETVHEPGGPLGGPNFADIERRARGKLIRANGGRDELARRVATGTVNEQSVVLAGRQPDGLREWVRRDLVELRKELRAISVTVKKGAVGTGQVNVREKLAQAVQARRAELVDAPATYGSVQERARVAARVAYVDAVLSRLREQAANVDDWQDAIERELAEYNGPSLKSIGKVVMNGPPAPEVQRPMLRDGIAGSVNVSVVGAPAYLTLSPVEHETVPAVADGTQFYPLAAKNVNVFTKPFADASDTVLDAVFGKKKKVSFRGAALTLQSANKTLQKVDNETLRVRRKTLRTKVSKGMVHVETRLEGVVRSRSPLDSGAAERAVARGLGQWSSVHGRALAVVNGTAARAVANAAASEGGLNSSEQDRLLLRLRFELREIRENDGAVKAPDSMVSKTAGAVRWAVEGMVHQGIQNLSERGFDRLKQRFGNRSLTQFNGGLPLFVPAHVPWVATTNVWWTNVKGTYAAFTIRARTGAPGEPVAYRRDGSAVTLDVDGDGERELLGWSTRISFALTIPVVVVVPPGYRGVADINGDADERSAGWGDPGPGPVRRGNESNAVRSSSGVGERAVAQSE